MSSAVLSEDERYRYVLRRQWSGTLEDLAYVGTRPCMFVMLNPSTADARFDDPTIRRCIGFATSWGYSALTVCNLFAYRATNPRFLYREAPRGIVGPANDEWIARCAAEAAVVIAAWGEHGAYLGRDKAVLELLADVGVYCLGRNASGQPKHPLYIAGDKTPVRL